VLAALARGGTGAEMAEQKKGLSVDWWSVAIALAAVLLVRFNLLPRIPW